MGKIDLKYNKTLKLMNVLRYRIDITDENINIEAQIEKMQSYIKIKGCVQIGPLVQYTKLVLNEAGEANIILEFMMQSNNYINNVKSPYIMDSDLRVQNCMYVRYCGPEEQLKYAYDKINLVSFEEDISLTGESYTIFVDKNEGEETIIADVFMPKIV